MIDTGRLLSLLLNTKLQKDDNSLYQFLRDLTTSVGDLNSGLQAQINSIVNNSTLTDQLIQQASISDSTLETDLIPLSSIVINNTISQILQLLADDGAGIDNNLITSPPSVNITNISNIIQNLLADDGSTDTNNLINTPFAGIGVFNQFARWISPNQIGGSILTFDGGSQIIVNGDFQVTANSTLSGTLQLTGDFNVNGTKFVVTASNGNISNAGVATLKSVVINTLVSTFGNSISYDGANQLFIGVPGTTTAKFLTIIDSSGNSLVTMNGVGDLSTTGNVTVGAEFILTISSVTAVYDGATSNNNLSSSTRGIVRVTASGGSTGVARISGFDGGVNGRVIIIWNADTTNSIVLLIEDAGSTAANRFAGTVASQTILSGLAVVLSYDGTTSRWRVCRVS